MKLWSSSAVSGWLRSAVGIVSLIVAVPACADCPAANRFKFSFASATAATLNYANSYSYTAVNDSGQTRVIGVSFIADGTTSTLVNGQQLPAISTLINDGGATNNNLVLGGIFAGRTANVSLNTRVLVAVFSFAVPIRDFSVQVNDIDFTANQFRDWLEVTASLGAATYVPSLTTPFGTNNSAAGPHTAAASSQVVGEAAAPVKVLVSQSGGTGASNNNSNTGTITASFIQPVTRVEVRDGNYPLQTGETLTGQQAIGIQAISFCPLPTVSFSKSSTPYVTAATDPKRFNAPGSDVIYALTLTNSNSSPLDLNQTILTDALPPEVSFYNGDIDDGGPLTTNFELLAGSSGLTLAPANLTYSNDGGVSYGFTPTAGYDPAINAIRINLQGALAANSSATVRFRARIK